MKIIKNSIGWEDEYGIQLAYNEECAFMNNIRLPKHKRPVWKDTNVGGENEVRRRK